MGFNQAKYYFGDIVEETDRKVENDRSLEKPETYFLVFIWESTIGMIFKFLLLNDSFNTLSEKVKVFQILTKK